MDKLSGQLSQTEQMARELRSRESDLQEALTAKDAQLGVLRVRYEEADKQVQGTQRLMEQVREEKDRCVKFEALYVHG